MAEGFPWASSNKGGADMRIGEEEERRTVIPQPEEVPNAEPVEEPAKEEEEAEAV